MSEISLQDALNEFLNNNRQKPAFQSARVELAWPKIMGKTIARYTQKIQIVNHTLYITTDVAPLKNELIFQKKLIIQRVNEVLGEPVITDVVVR
ncbi:MAG: DUF721 domain-containing protein [Ferruginibacter sp.]|nr:DUF721 domain-containing protein [Ferruginibacter sp.]